MLDDAVRAGEDQGLVTVGEPDEVRRRAVLAPDLQYLTVPFLGPNCPAAHMEQIANLGMHQITSAEPQAMSDHHRATEVWARHLARCVLRGTRLATAPDKETCLTRRCIGFPHRPRSAPQLLVEW